MKILLKSCMAVLTLSIFLLTGCASMFGDNTRQISIKSNPEGAAIFMDGVNYGQTPSIITLPERIYGGKIIELRKPGYQTQSILINSKFQPVGLWNLISPFFLGFAIDGLTGNTVKIDPAQLNTTRDLASEGKK
jgi:hypothetical protein